MSEISKRIRAYVNDPTVADNYGAWGALRPDQRRQIRELCDTCDRYEQAADSMQGTIVKLVAEVERLNEALKNSLPSYCRACSEEEAIKIGKQCGKAEALTEIKKMIDKAYSEVKPLYELYDAPVFLGEMRAIQKIGNSIILLQEKNTGGNKQ